MIPLSPSPQTYTLFLDETGNTGPHYDSAEQPIYAEAGWLVADNDRVALEQRFLGIGESYQFTAKTKGTKLKDSHSGRQYLATVIEEMAKTAIPFFYLVEKRYFICAKAVGTYFDPNFNPMVETDDPNNPVLRKARADALYSAPQAVISAFAKAYREKEAGAFKTVGEQWAALLARRGEAGLAMQLRCSLPAINENMSEEFIRQQEFFPRGYDTLNAPSVAQVCQLIEQRGLRCKMVHDHCPHESIYRFFYDHYRNAEHKIKVRRDGSHEVFGFQGLYDMEFGDSEEMPLLRAADYLVAACGEFARLALAGETIPAEIRRGAHHGLARMMLAAVGKPVVASGTDWQIGELMAADAWIAKVAQAFNASGTI